MKITDEFLADLEAKAKAAMPGAWVAEHSERADGCSIVTTDQYDAMIADCLTVADAEYIDATQPAHILALIDKLREVRRDVNRMLQDIQIGYEEGRRR